MLRLLIANEISGIVSTLEKLSPFADQVEPCGMARDAETLVAEAARLQPDVVLLNLELGGEDGAALIRSVAAASPASAIILIGDIARHGQGSALPGGHEVVSASAGGREILETLGRSRHREAAPSVELEPMRPLRPRPARRGPPGRGEIVLVFAGKGGVGKSMVATNLAVAMGQSTRRRVALVDLDLQFGDVALMLGMEHYEQSMETLAQEGELVDSQLLDAVMVAGPGGIRALLAPPAPELAELITPRALRGILREVARAHDFVVIDGPAHLDEQTLEVIEVADHILVITSSSVAAVKDTRIMLKLLRSLGTEMDRVSIVLNHTRARSTLIREDIEDRLRHRIRLQLPFEHRIVDDAVDRGTPFVVGEPESEIAGRISWLAQFLATASAAPPAVTPEPEPRRNHAFRRRFSLGRREQPV